MTEWHASDYSRESALQEAMAEEVLGRLSLQVRERILDVGCGDGKITAKIARRVSDGSVIGVDPSRDMVAFASKHFGSPVAANLRFEVADACQLPFENEFDLVVSFNALHWVTEQGAALQSIHRVLKPGGRGFLRFVPAGPRKSLEDVIEDVRQEDHWASYFVGVRRPYIDLTPEEYRGLAEVAGFHVVRLSVDDKAWDFQSRDAFVAFCHATFVEWTRFLPEGERRHFILEVLDSYESVAAETPAEANTFKFYQMEVVLEAVSPSRD
ncbi:MAG: class I SAM-dependent methyltransferase [Planctomycetaceae bacterium]|nr:MAG: class I SAM-dependent methyltransferase [Planctomycetaceae bacterium]